MHSFSKASITAGKALLKEKQVVHILFSQGTYQIEVIGSKKPKQILWPFLQLNDAGDVLDAFCTCAAFEKKGSCPHLAAAYLKIMQEEPLHVRFRDSLWNKIGLICAGRHGFENQIAQTEKEGFAWYSQTGKRLLFIHPHTTKRRAHLEEILFHRPVETEETSLKFSNLDPEELTLWREGRPSEQFRYELSCWSDLAKWWMLLQEEESYSITFSQEEPPHTLYLHFPHLDVEFYIGLSNWPELIPSLASVHSPLQVFPYLMGKLEKMVFSKEKGEFILEFEEEGKLPPMTRKKEEGVKVGEWLFFKDQGFFPREPDPLLQEKVILKSQVNTFLHRYLKLIQKNLPTEKIHPSRIPVCYQLSFDEQQDLHIGAYVFKKGDLLQPEAHYFGDWVYLPTQGFFQLENQIFNEPEVKIPKEKVSEFINRHRVWLQMFEGFQTHVSGLASRLGFRFNEEGQLLFFARLELTWEHEPIIDLGEWIYVEGKGFYAKITEPPGSLIKAGMTVNPFELSTFISRHRDELESIPGFFAHECPLEKTGLSIQFNEEGRIVISPEFFMSQRYEQKQVELFGDYTYVEKEGFFLIPHKSRLPVNYQKEKKIDQVAEPYFVGYELDLLYPHVLSIDPKLKRPKKMDLCLTSLKKEMSAKTGQWVVQLYYETDIGMISVHDIWKGIWQGEHYLFSEAGLIFLRDKRFDWLRQKTKKWWLKGGSFLRFTTLEFLRLVAFEDILEPKGETKKHKEIRKLFRDFLSFKAPTEVDISGLKSDLRLYQKTGVAWLWFLYSYGLSGLLCDEMGLGKTHQAMGLIAGIKNAYPERKIRVLVVCPTSVIYHWEKLIQTFLPSIKPYIFHGLNRRFEAFSENSYELLLTSYGIVRTENKALSNFDFDLVILDELQVAKNEKSMTNKALRNLSASMRLGLTGTPIENRLMELKTLFDLVLPSYLPSASVFRELFINPIERFEDEKQKFLLRRLTRPFLLRRKKSEVLTELPEKIEEIALCDLSAEQYTLYREIFKENRQTLLREVKDTSRPPPITHIFSMIAKLKQVCDHPSLILGDKQDYKKHTSGKWELFLELLNETRDSGQKLVVFSQYLDMLDIIGMHLTEEKIGYAEIRGTTKDRKGQVERFSTDPSCEVFLGSLQAAGVGIDLIAASVVIHYDRWWNPAKENQATDRVHRMGQKRGVQVFKLVTKNSIEEHIHRLIEKKQSLAKGVIGFDDQDHIKGIQRQELMEILHLIERDVKE